MMLRKDTIRASRQSNFFHVQRNQGKRKLVFLSKFQLTDTCKNQNRRS
uniref:Uncharacterized protein n=1 Tax=Rhizophora mucronata TaxID=61149 RepID=A0A2P2INF2_RHIMU